MRRSDITDILPLAPLQEGLFFHALYDDEAEDVYQVQQVWDLHGALDAPALRAAADGLLERHPHLKAAFWHEGLERPLQVIGRDVPLPWQEFDVRGDADPAAEAERIVREERQRRFRLDRPPLLRFTLIRTGDERHRLVLSNHHILLDGWSMPVLLRELFALYRDGRAHGLPRPTPYRDYLAHLAAQDGEGAREAWRTALAGVDGATLVAPADRARQGAYPVAVSGELTEEQTAALTGFARSRGLTVNTVVQGVWALLLNRWTGRDDVVFGATVAGRPPELPGADTMVGLFINTLPVRCRLDPAEPVADFLGRLQGEQADLMPHQHIGLGEIQRIAGTGELFDTVTVFENYPDTEREPGGEGLRLVPVHSRDAAHYPLTLSAALGARLRIELSVVPGLFDARAPQRLLAHVRRALTAVVEAPHLPVGLLDVLDPAERHTVLHEVNDTARAFPSGTVPDLLQAQAARTPDALALVCGERRLTFAEVNRRSSALARHLIGLGAGPEKIVALCLPRTADAVVALFAVLKTGAAHLVLDPEQPADRIALLLDDAGVSLAVTSTATEASLPGVLPRVVLDEPGTPRTLAGLSGADVTDADRLAPVLDATAAYVLYTSGSTGRPKGVVIEHGPLANLFHDHVRYLYRPEVEHSGPLRGALSAALTFDTSWMMLLWLVGGYETHLLTDEVRGDPEAMVGYVREHRIGFLDVTPTFTEQLVAAGLLDEGEHHPPLITLGGEAAGSELWRRLRAAPGVRAYNQYGPTECTMDTLGCRLADSDDPVIGRPLSNTRVLVLDARLRPVPIGLPGELYLAGAPLARGYLGRAALTAERFVACPYGEPGSRMYRTGDLVRLRADGQVEYLGRTDDQVKVRGYRIEPGEIAAQLTAHADVSQAVVTVGRDRAGGQRLVAHLVAAPGARVDAGVLRKHLASVLPPYMVPAAYVVLDALPLTAHGKLDRRALPEPGALDVVVGQAPRSPREEILAGLFAEVLDTTGVGADDDFFALGGHSLLATRLISRVRAALGVELPVRALFEHPTVARLAARLDDGGAARPALTAGPRPERVPLSAGQLRLWFLDRLEGPGPAYHTTAAFRLEGDLDPEALAHAVADLTRRHESLRTVYPDHEGVPWQRVLTPEEAATRLERAEVSDEELARELELATARGFLLDTEVPFRASLFTLSPTAHVLLLVMHHICDDGLSAGPLHRDLWSAYADRCEGRAPRWEPLPVQYADYALWQREVLGGADGTGGVLAEQSAHWTAVLKDLPAELDLPVDHPGADRSLARGTLAAFRLEPDVHAALTALARESGVTLFMVLQAALATLLTRTGAGTDIPLGTVVAGRTDDQLDPLIGFFVNTLVLRTDTSGDPTFHQLLTRVRDTDLTAYTHQDLPFERLVEALNPPRAAGRHPLFQTMLTLRTPSPGTDEVTGLRVAPHAVGSPAAKFDVSVDFEELRSPEGRPQGITGELVLNGALFDQPTADRLARGLHRLLLSAAERPDERLSRLPLTSPQERELVLGGWSGRAATEPPADLLSAYAESVAAAPGSTALVDGGLRLTRAQLDDRAEHLAARLRARGVAAEDRVALLMERSADLVVAILAVLKAGAAYVPLLLDHPAARLRLITADTGARLLLTDTAGGAHPAADGNTDADGDNIDVLDVTGCARADVPATHGTPAARPHPDRLAYLMYTSGSSGGPKGVAITHRDVTALAADSAWRGGGHRAVLLHSSHAFDASTYELWVPLLTGGRVVVAPPGGLTPAAVRRLTDEEGLSAVWLTAGLFAAFADEDPACLGGLREVWAGGEAVSPGAVARVLERCPELTVVNGYGPTETTTFAARHHLAAPYEPGQRIPVGRPLDGMRAYVLDDCLQPVAAHARGELYLAGEGLARGYWNRAALTAERFVACPYGEPGSRMYRTGDLVRWDAEGRLEFLGRADDQVKLRGFRLEPGEIEDALARHPDVARAKVTVHQDAHGERRLVAHVVAVEGRTPEPGAVLDAVRGELPPPLVPSACLVLDRFPLTVNGKVDVRALPAPEAAATTGRAPLGARQRALAALFAEVLGTTGVGADDDFFALGGHSLLATRLISRVRTALGVELPLRALFEAPTVARLAERLPHAGRARRAVAPAPRPERVPLSYAQQRVWFLEQFEGPSAMYNVPLALTLSGPVDTGALAAALQDVTDRHEVLRTVYPHHEGVPHQLVLSGDAARTRLHTLTLAEPELAHALDTAAEYAFDIGTELPLLAALYTITPTEHVLLLVTHHIATDGSSFGPLLRDLAEAYAARCEGQAPGWEPLPVQYADYALWQREVLGGAQGGARGDGEDADSPTARQLDYWRTALAGIPDQLPLPFDRPRPAVASHRGARRRLTLDAELHAGLTGLARESGVTLFMVLQAALATLLTRTGAGTDIPLGTVVAGRTDDQLDPLIGFFVNTLVLRTDTSGDPTFHQLLTRVRDTDLTAYTHQDLPFERLVEALNPPRSLAYHPLFQVHVALHNTGRTDADFGALRVGEMPVGTQAAKFDLSLDFIEHRRADGTPDGLEGDVEYDTDLFDAATVEQLVERLRRLLAHAVRAPGTRLSGLELMSCDERRQVLTGWNAAHRDVPPGTVVELFDEQVRRTPDAPALLCGESLLSYAQLHGRAERLARRLAGLGVGPGERAVLLLPRTADAIVAMLAVLRAGAAYVPLDPDAPAARLQTVLADIRPAAVLTTAALAGSPAHDGLRVVAVDGPAADAPGPVPAAHRPGPDDPAYVIYTSGTTGRPKGVVVPHGGLTNLLGTLGRDLAADAPEGPEHWLNVVPFTFDVSALDIHGALTNGALLVLASSDEVRDPVALTALIGDAGITRTSATPTLWQQLVAQPPERTGALRGLRAIVGGEALPAQLLRALHARGVAVDHVYGPTEATVWATVTRPVPGPDQRGPSIGRPLPNTGAYVLDASLAPQPPGVPGELYLSGAQLALGYWRRPALTAERFVACPYGEPGSRMYRTGDLARWGRDGQLEFLGRVDRQAKVRGHRVEPGEIESVLAAHPLVSAAAVLVREDRPGDARLVAYVTCEGELPVAGLRAHLGARLPDYMVPSAFVALDALPTTTSGKVDHKALPAPEAAAQDAPAGEAASPLAAALAALFADALGVPSVGAGDDFFAQGGHSLLAARLVGRIESVLGHRVRVRDLFEARTPARLAALLSGAAEHQREHGALDVLLPLATGGGAPPLFCVHPARGLSWSYAGLVRHLGADRPLYGLQARGLAADVPLPGDLAEMAEEYLAHIRRVQPAGPYHLLGWSFGGNVAHLIAARLRALGEEVALLALLDAYPPGAVTDADPAQDVVTALLRDLGHGDELPELPVGRPQLRAFLEERGSAIAGFDERQLDALLTVFDHNLTLLDAARTPVFDGDVLFFTAARDLPEGLEPARAWAPYVGGRFEEHRVDCAHHEMTRPGPLAEIAAVLTTRTPDRAARLEVELPI
ncbi:amino acid adenylation domain-containing protein [Streptomyces sp. NPDC050504]|uniref:amino acid adenylation domain-containing protein n=1 Tax=Streptomyces sp. NPDC050504 TaxID=3365618 RepID=UPI0037A15F1C